MKLTHTEAVKLAAKTGGVVRPWYVGPDAQEEMLWGFYVAPREKSKAEEISETRQHVIAQPGFIDARWLECRCPA